MYALGIAPFERAPLPQGTRGTRQTVDAMTALARGGSSDPAIRNNALHALRTYGSTPHDHVSEARALFAWVRDRVKYVQDPVSSEWVQSPRATLEAMAGDCDDMAVLLAAMLGAIGIPSKFRVVALDRSRPGEFSHVYTVAMIGGREFPMDPIYPSNPFGLGLRGSRMMELSL